MPAQMIIRSQSEGPRRLIEGVMLMQGKTENDRVRPCAYPILGGKQWVVHLVQYPGRSDPLMEDLEARKA
jgi:hypothetical protein